MEATTPDYNQWAVCAPSPPFTFTSLQIALAQNVLTATRNRLPKIYQNFIGLPLLAWLGLLGVTINCGRYSGGADNAPSWRSTTDKVCKVLIKYL